MTLASFFRWADQFESYLVKKNPEDTFSHDAAQINQTLFYEIFQF